MVTIVNGAAGTIQIKLGAGQLDNIIGVSAGTSYTYVVKDGPDINGNFKTLYGSTPIPVVAGQNLRQNSLRPVPFTNGLAVTVAGSPGEFEIEWT